MEGGGQDLASEHSYIIMQIIQIKWLYFVMMGPWTQDIYITVPVQFSNNQNVVK